MRVLLEALLTVLTGSTPPVPVPGGIRVGHVSEEENPAFPAIRLMQQGGESPLPVAGVEHPLVLVQVWSRKNPDEAIDLYGWVSSKINQRHRDLTAAMGGRGYCWLFVRQWKSWPLYDDLYRAWYVTARYYAKAVDFGDLHAAFSG